MMAIKVRPCVSTLRLKVRAEGYAWLNAAATEVNRVWNYAKAEISALKAVARAPVYWIYG